MLAELAWFGSIFEPTDDLRRPANMRLIAVPLQEALRSVITDRTRLRIELQVDGAPLRVLVENGEVSVRVGADPDASVVLATDYESLLASGEGRIPIESFFADHVAVVRGSARDAETFGKLMARAFASEG